MRFKKLMNFGGACLTTVLLPTTLVNAQPAFPGAQGGGAASVGGRGGTVIEVTNLNDDGPGSLRACAQEASGPRTCVFRVSGIIELTSDTIVVINPYLTVAGQTAPGGGITLSGRNLPHHMVAVATHDVIWRYTRIRHGYYANTPLNDGSNFVLWASAYNVIFDHNSSSWAQSEGAGGDESGDPSVYTLKSETFSWNLIAEPLAAHPTGVLWSCTSGSGGTPNWCDSVTDIDLHHNLLMSDSHRNPLVNFKSGRWVNNIVYNVGFYYTAQGPGVQLDAIGNIYKQGPLFATYWGYPNKIIHEFQVATGCADLPINCPTGNPSLYLLNNMGPNQSNPAGNQWAMAATVSYANQAETGPVPAAYQRTTPLPPTTYPIQPDPVTNLETVMLPTVGASQRLDCDGTWVSNRDSVDARLISEYQTNTGINFFPTTESAVGGFPTIAAGLPCTETIHDGIPDVWKIANGLNPNGPSMANAIAPNGYTYLENYLNGPSSGLPNLEIASLSYNSATGLFSSVVTNIGAAPTPAGVYVGNGFYVDGNAVSWGSVLGPLAAGASVTIDSSGGGAFTIPPGTHTITVIADNYGCCGRIAESDKPTTTASDPNDTLTQTITVP
jgi:pectate lyase